MVKPRPFLILDDGVILKILENAKSSVPQTERNHF